MVIKPLILLILKTKNLTYMSLINLVESINVHQTVFKNKPSEMPCQLSKNAVDSCWIKKLILQ